ncbi:MAG: hypothetical protein ACFFCS_18875 [Candidatus Hodarchaeota archaeon]
MSDFMPFTITELVVHLAILQLATIRAAVLHHKGKREEDPKQKEFYVGKVKQSRTIIVGFLLVLLVRATAQYYPPTSINNAVFIPFVSVASLVSLVVLELLIALLFMNFLHERT